MVVVASCVAVVLKLYTVSQKKTDTELLPITSPSISRFSIFFTDEFSCEFAQTHI